jgi:hypothetical protein
MLSSFEINDKRKIIRFTTVANTSEFVWGLVVLQPLLLSTWNTKNPIFQEAITEFRIDEWRTMLREIFSGFWFNAESKQSSRLVKEFEPSLMPSLYTTFYLSLLYNIENNTKIQEKKSCPKM